MITFLIVLRQFFVNGYFYARGGFAQKQVKRQIKSPAQQLREKSRQFI